MTAYARSDVVSVTVSRSHRGCGQVHTRPVVNGAPARLWALTCPQCEPYLLKDPLWSATTADVPSTPDEDLARDSAQKSTTRSREDLMALALAKIAGLPVAEFLGEITGQVEGRGTVKCAAGHENFPTAKFCAECGASMSAAPALARAEKPERVTRQPRQPRVIKAAASRDAGLEEELAEVPSI